MKKKKSFLPKITFIILTISAVVMLMIGGCWFYINSDLIYGFLKYNDMYSAIHSVDGCKVQYFEEHTTDLGVHSVYFDIFIGEPSYSKCLDILSAADTLLSDSDNILNKNNSIINLKFSVDHGENYYYTYFMEASNIFDFDRISYGGGIQTVYRKNYFCSVLVNAAYEPFYKMQDILVLKRDSNILNVIVTKTLEPLTDYLMDSYDDDFYQYLQEIRMVFLTDKFDEADRKRIADLNFQLGESKIKSQDNFYSEYYKFYILLVRLSGRDFIDVENVINVS